MGESGYPEARLGLRAAVLLAGVWLVGACASTPEPVPVEVEPPVTLRSVADELELFLRTDPRYDRVLLEAPDGDRISARAGTPVLTVRGTRYEAAAPVEERDGELWLTEQDARTIRAIWESTGHFAVPSPVPGSMARPAPAERYLTIDDLPDLPPDAPASTDATPRPNSRNVASKYEQTVWGVPLRRTWNYIVMHHSASASGNAAIFHKAHLANGWDGLGYHFVIGNGHGSRDGEIEVGWRWRQQREGAHAGNDDMNQQGIGICLVGDFTKTRPTAAQMRSLQRLSDYLAAYCAIPTANLRYHRDVRDKERGGTECPGTYFPKSFRFRPAAGVPRGPTAAAVR